MIRRLIKRLLVNHCGYAVREMDRRMLFDQPAVRRCHYCGIVLNNKEFATIALKELADAGVNPLKDVCLRHGKKGEEIFDVLRGISLEAQPAPFNDHIVDIAFADLRFWFVIFWNRIKIILRFCVHAAIHPIRYYRYRQWWQQFKGAER